MYPNFWNIDKVALGLLKIDQNLDAVLLFVITQIRLVCLGMIPFNCYAPRSGGSSF